MEKLAVEGSTVEAGSFQAILEKKPGRCCPSWKDEAIKLAVASGKLEEKYEAEVKALYPPKMVTNLEIIKSCVVCGNEKEIK